MTITVHALKRALEEASLDPAVDGPVGGAAALMRSISRNPTALTILAEKLSTRDGSYERGVRDGLSRASNRPGDGDMGG